MYVFRQTPVPANHQDLLFSASYADPGGLVIFNMTSVRLGGRASDTTTPLANGGGGGDTAAVVVPASSFPAELSTLIRNDTARANRVHLHPSGVAFLALEKGHGDDSRGGLAAVDVRDPRVPTLLEAVRTPDNSSRTYFFFFFFTGWHRRRRRQCPGNTMWCTRSGRRVRRCGCTPSMPPPQTADKNRPAGLKEMFFKKRRRGRR